LSTTLAAGPVKSNGAGAFISQAIALGGAEVSGTLAVGMVVQELYHLLLVVYLEVIMLERYQWLLQILLLL
jgi:hypothetical protein